MCEMFGTKDSFERFYGDLKGVIEVMVSYLPLEERLRFECLSKRFQTLITNINDKVVDIDVDDKLVAKMYGKNIFGKQYFAKKYLQILMKKCPNITRVDTTRVTNRDDLWLFLVSLNGMRDNWPQLMTIGLKLSETADNIRESLFEMFGQLIQELDATNALDFDHSLLSNCQQLSHLKVDSLGIYNNFAALLDMKSLKSLSIGHTYGDSDSTEAVIELMSQLSQLSELSLNFSYITHSLADSLRKIGLKLKKLKKLSLSVMSDNQVIILDSFKSMDAYRGLRCLELCLRYDGQEVADWHELDSMQCLPQLRHLSLHLWQISNELIAKITRIFPNIQSLDIKDWSNCYINDINLVLIARLRLLKTLKIQEAIDICVDEWDLKAMFARSDRLVSIHIVDDDKTYIQYKYKHIIQCVPELSTPANSPGQECRCCHCRELGD